MATKNFRAEADKATTKQPISRLGNMAGEPAEDTQTPAEPQQAQPKQEKRPKIKTERYCLVCDKATAANIDLLSAYMHKSVNMVLIDAVNHYAESKRDGLERYKEFMAQEQQAKN